MVRGAVRSAAALTGSSFTAAPHWLRHCRQWPRQWASGWLRHPRIQGTGACCFSRQECGGVAAPNVHRAKLVSEQLDPGPDPVQGVSGLLSPRLSAAQAAPKHPPTHMHVCFLQQKDVCPRFQQDEGIEWSVITAVCDSIASSSIPRSNVRLPSPAVILRRMRPRARCAVLGVVLCWLRRCSAFARRIPSKAKFHPIHGPSMAIHQHTALLSQAIPSSIGSATPPSSLHPSIHSFWRSMHPRALRDPSSPPLSPALHPDPRPHPNLHRPASASRASPPTTTQVTPRRSSNVANRENEFGINRNRDGGTACLSGAGACSCKRRLQAQAQALASSSLTLFDVPSSPGGPGPLGDSSTLVPHAGGFRQRRFGLALRPHANNPHHRIRGLEACGGGVCPFFFSFREPKSRWRRLKSELKPSRCRSKDGPRVEDQAMAPQPRRRDRRHDRNPGVGWWVS